VAGRLHRYCSLGRFSAKYPVKRDSAKWEDTTHRWSIGRSIFTRGQSLSNKDFEAVMQMLTIFVIVGG